MTQLADQSPVRLANQLTKPSSTNHLVETVSINYEDFADAFLTCATCLTTFDTEHKRAKLLSCSHSVCAACLERIVSLPQALETGAFRCPICRAMHQIPRGGISELPPSYLVNQLLDLMQKQRRHIVPTCGSHADEELLFCETCDRVFCTQCKVERDIGQTCHNHTIVPFSIAIKRMSEILLYKANQCLRNLNRAQESVREEQEQLDTNVDRILDEVNASFQSLTAMLDARRKQLVDLVRKTRDDKRKVLQEQIGIIQSEKAKVEQQCNSSLGQQVDVRSITRRIADMNDKIDTSLTLIEPRENAFLKYDCTTEQVLSSIQNALAHFGQLSVSRTYPPLCTARVHGDCTLYIRSTVLVTTVDYHGEPRTSGGDPVRACFVTGDKLQDVVDDIAVHVDDRHDGTYELSFRAHTIGTHHLDVRIFNRPIRGSPLKIQIDEHHSPLMQIGSEGDAAHQLRQPTRVLPASCDGNSIFVLDTGNCRVQTISLHDGVAHRSFTKNECLQGQAAISMALAHSFNESSSLYILNWRHKLIGEICASSGADIRSFTFSEFVEPIDIAVDSRGRILVADNGTRSVFVFDHQAKPLFSFAVGGTVTRTEDTSPKTPTKQPKSESVLQERQTNATVEPQCITCMAIGLNEDILVTLGSTVYVHDCCGKLMRTMTPVNGANTAAIIGGMVVDRLGARVLLTVSEQKRSTYCAVLGYKGDLRFKIDSFGAKMRRPTGVCLTVDGEHCLIADLGNHCVKQFRFA